jgi:hypothetical protein
VVAARRQQQGDSGKWRQRVVVVEAAVAVAAAWGAGATPPLPLSPHYQHGSDHRMHNLVGSTFSGNYKYELKLDKVIIQFN